MKYIRILILLILLQPLSSIMAQQENRITSYNVCYTKLLREQNPNYTFTEPGSYKITLMAIDEHGCYGNASKAKYITVSKVPHVNFTITGDTPCELPYQPIITNNTSIDGVDEPVVYINNWEWKINDKVVSNKQELDYSFEKKGNYTISLAAQMGECTDSSRVEEAVVLSVDTLDYNITQEGPGLKDSIRNNFV